MTLHLPSRVKLASHAAALIVVLLMSLVYSSGAREVRAQSGVSVALDADASNGSGACSPVDDSADVAEGGEIRVAVCLTNSGSVPVAAFGFRVTYDDRIILAPEVVDSGAALDDNPDANAGATTFSSPSLTGAWDCTGSVGAYPEGDDDGERNGTGVAYSGGCANVPGGGSFTQGPLSVIRFIAQGGGEARLTLTTVAITADDLTEIGSCAPVVDVAIDCEGATINVSGAPVPGVTPGEVITPGTQTVGGTPVPGASETAVALETAAAGTPGAGGTPGSAGTAGADDTPDEDETPTSGTRTPSRTGTPGTGTASPDDGDDDDDGGAGIWIIVGALVVAVAVAGGGAAYWFRFRSR
jgi:pilus assembly protein FimV